METGFEWGKIISIFLTYSASISSIQYVPQNIEIFSIARSMDKFLLLWMQTKPQNTSTACPRFCSTHTSVYFDDRQYNMSWVELYLFIQYLYISQYASHSPFLLIISSLRKTPVVREACPWRSCHTGSLVYSLPREGEKIISLSDST